MLKQGAALPPQTEQFLHAFAEKNTLELVGTLSSMEKQKRDQLIPILEDWVRMLEEALACRSGMRCVYPSSEKLAAQRSSQELMNAISHLQKAITYARSNVSPAAICGYLTWQLK